VLNPVTIHTGNLLLSLSEAIDLAAPAVSSHQLRVAYAAWRLGCAAGLCGAETERLLIAALLHDIGALEDQEKLRLIQGAEDHIERHCVRGEALLGISPLLAPAAPIVRHHHRPWSEWHDARIDDPSVLGAQILLLADTVERLVRRDVYILHQEERISEEIGNLSRGQIHPDLIDLYFDLARREDFWLDLTSGRLYSLILRCGPFRNEEIGLREICPLSLLFRYVIDYRSRFTATHSSGVAVSAAALGRAFGLTASEVNMLRIAGNLHDLGKLAVPNAILDKDGPLNRSERALMRQHTHVTYTILSSVGGMPLITEWASFHHERLDGTGYPFHLNAARLDTGARVLAVADIFAALTEDRPYRQGLGFQPVREILRKMVREGALDGRLVEVLVNNYGEIAGIVEEERRISLANYERAAVGAGIELLCPFDIPEGTEEPAPPGVLGRSDASPTLRAATAETMEVAPEAMVEAGTEG
jgi:HD-GYP domain-containing protein (c-di-GMP phosphodiesterase class II)